MKTKIFLITVTGFILSLFSCNSAQEANDGTDTSIVPNNESIAIPRIEKEPEFEVILNVSNDWPWKWRYTDEELVQITLLSALVPDEIKADFDKKYLEWTKTWSRPDIAISSVPRAYALSDEYKALLNYCESFGKAIWPLLFEKSATGTFEEGIQFSSNLLEDLTFSQYTDLFEYIRSFFGSQPDPVSASISNSFCCHIVYSRNLLKLEYDNILQSILENFQ